MTLNHVTGGEATARRVIHGTDIDVGECVTPQEFRTWLDARLTREYSFPDPVVASENDRLVAALTAFGEIRGGSYDDKIAVLNTIANRAKQKHKSFVSVCLQPMQFSCWTPLGGKDNYDALMSMVIRVIGAVNLGKVLTTFNTSLSELLYLVEGVIEGAIADNTHGATHYYVKSTPVPHWAIGKVPCAVVGPHLFFDNIAW